MSKNKKPTVISPVSFGSVEPRDIRQRFSDVINVKDFGAKGDGITNDSAAIQLALDQRGVVFFPPGEYKLDKHIVFKSNTTAIGDQAILKRSYLNDGSTSSLGWVLYSSGETICENVHITGIVFDYNGQNYTQPANIITINPNSNNRMYKDLTFENCVFKNWVNMHALDVAGTNGFNVLNCKFLNCKYDESLVDPNNRNELTALKRREAIQLDSGGNTGMDGEAQILDQNFKIINCYFGTDGKVQDFGSPRVGVGTHAGPNYINAYSKNVVIHDCVFDGCSYAGISAYGFRNSNIEGNQFINCKYGIILDTRLSYQDTTLYRCASDNSIICGNVFQNDEISEFFKSGFAVYCRTAMYDNFSNVSAFVNDYVGIRNLTVCNNFITGFERAFQSGGCFDCKFDSNTIINCGVVFGGVGKGISFSHNMVTNCGVSYITNAYWDYTPNRDLTLSGRDVVFQGNVFKDISNTRRVIDIHNHDNVLIDSNFIIETGTDPEVYNHYIVVEENGLAVIRNNVVSCDNKRAVNSLFSGSTTSVESHKIFNNMWFVNGIEQEEPTS